jgi:hypothetical protein
MQPTSLLCRAQEARHLALASDAILDNVRTVATRAAAAWAKEAELADRREARKAESQRLALSLSLAPPKADDRSFSENPDRGFAYERIAE